MISYKKTRSRNRLTRQQLAGAQQQLDRLTIENRQLKEQLNGAGPVTRETANGGRAGDAGSASTPDSIATLRSALENLFGHREGMLGYFLDYSSTLAFINTTEGVYQYSNNAFARYVGTTPDKVIGRSVFELFSEEDAKNYIRVNRETFHQGKIVKFIDPMQDENGQTSYILTTVFPLPVPGGLEWVGGLSIDITEHYMLEKASRQTEERLGSLISQLPVYVFDVDNAGIITKLDGQGLSGITGEAVVGKSVERVYRDFPEIIASYYRAMQGEVVHSLARFTENSTYELRIAPIYDETGLITGVSGTALDVTRQTQIWDKLRQSEQRFIKVFNSAPLPIAIARTSDGTIVNTNFAFSEMSGYSESELIDRNIFELLGNPPGSAALQNQSGEDSLFAVRNREVVITHKNGARLTLLLSTEQVDFDGEQCFIATCLDITEQKRIEAAKRETEERLEAILFNSPVYIFAKDKEGRYLMFNRFCEEFSGLAAKDVIGKTTFELFGDDPEEAARMVEEDTEVLRTRKPLVVENVGEQGGNFFSDITTKFPMYDAEGEVYAVGAISVDITERKLAEKELAAEKEQLAVTLSSIADGVITTNPLGQVMLINRVAEEITGWNQSEGQHEHLEQVFNLRNPQNRPPEPHPVYEVLRTGLLPKLMPPFFLLLARDGTERPIELSVAGIYDGRGNISGSVLVFRDISEKFKIIEEYQKVTQLESLGLLAGGIAHDFNNLLTAIVGSISVARIYSGRPEMLERLRQSLDRAEKAGLQSKELTQQLLTFAKGGAPIKQTASLPELIRDSANFVLQGSNIERNYLLPTDTWLVEVDPGQLSQVVHNLVLNALQAMPEGGTLTISAENLPPRHPALRGLPLVEGPYVRFTVRDTGTGITSENLTRIFDPYFTTKAAGNGLGLTICYSIIRNHQGHIQVLSTSNQGTVFNIFLPALETGP
jgi:PAS domain S-box-containing protein